MTTQQTDPTAPQTSRQETGEQSPPAAGKRPFVEPVVSVPADVLEATTQLAPPTIQAASVPPPPVP